MKIPAESGKTLLKMETRPHMTPRRAIALLSGGLDSAIAAKMIKNQGVEVIGLHLASPFTCKADVQKTADEIGIPLLYKDKGEAFLDLLENPQYGRGRAMNPCIDCRIYMFELAEKVMLDQHADFVVTGEVLGQRPMSQQSGAMALIDRKSPIEGRVVRPLSAHTLEPTLPEREGWVDREKFLGISGRGRKEQLALAKDLGLVTFSSPGGGCLLTETGFSARLQDFFKYRTYETTEQRIAQSKLLRLGRHFRIDDKGKMIIGRNEEENRELEKLVAEAGGLLFQPGNFDGPSAVFLGTLSPFHEEKILATIARYGKKREARTAFKGKQEVLIQTEASESELEGMRL